MPCRSEGNRYRVRSLRLRPSCRRKLHIVLNSTGSDIPAGKACAVEEAIYRGIRELGGSFSAEHGIGAKRVAPLSALSDPAKLALMHRIKGALDAPALLNPGKVLN
ncbi:FAD-linked oxidase C-terminal domain-containing protein [Shinella sp.]|uniref:FAD-linked oxidase C-terminal domain-containing protein n=1 Tax=unclassified Shinella TaxID=2643062 RepID=UPI0028AC555B|nr:FAD-linked oxidase C-terminal domain-containing protein [Shinella sp.]